MNEIVEKVRAFAQENELFAPGQRLCAAVSGCCCWSSRCSATS